MLRHFSKQQHASQTTKTTTAAAAAKTVVICCAEPFSETANRSNFVFLPTVDIKQRIHV